MGRREALQAILGYVGLPPTHVDVFRIIIENPGITRTEIAEQLNETTNGINYALNQLKFANLIKITKEEKRNGRGRKNYKYYPNREKLEEIKEELVAALKDLKL